MRIVVMLWLMCGVVWGGSPAVLWAAEVVTPENLPEKAPEKLAAPVQEKASEKPVESPLEKPLVRVEQTDKEKDAKKTGEILRKAPGLEISAQYPRLGVDGIDADLATWVEYMVAQFEQSAASEEREAEAPPYVLDISYTVERPSSRAVSVIFEISTYTGGAHGNLAIVSRNYDTQSGVLLTPSHLFEDLELALTIFSSYCYERLADELGQERQEPMLKSGTTPDADNFSTLSLNEVGVRVHFAPYQVAPWSSGALFVDVPLAALVEAHPVLELWGRPPLEMSQLPRS